MGRDLVALARSDIQSNAATFGVYHGGQWGGYSQRMVRESRWTYIWNPTSTDELYDLENDAGEKQNLATQEGFAPEISRLRARLVTWMESTRDPLLNVWTRRLLREEPVVQIL